MAKNMQPKFDKFELEAFKAAGHSRKKVLLWALALLSGRYKQGTGRLENTDGTMCCVGVLCRINGLERTVSPDTGSIKYDKWSAWVDPAKMLGGDTYGDDYPDFSSKNDQYGATFLEIGLFLLRSLFPIRKEMDKRYDHG